MNFDVGDLLGNLFGGAVVPTLTPEPAGPSADAPTTDTAPAAEAGLDALGLDLAERAWAADAWQPWEDCLPVESIQPCPTCGSLDLWWDLLGGVHCQHCDGEVFRRSLELLDLAERIRGRKQ